MHHLRNLTRCYICQCISVINIKKVTSWFDYFRCIESCQPSDTISPFLSSHYSNDWLFERKKFKTTSLKYFKNPVHLFACWNDIIISHFLLLSSYNYMATRIVLNFVSHIFFLLLPRNEMLWKYSGPHQ